MEDELRALWEEVHTQYLNGAKHTLSNVAKVPKNYYEYFVRIEKR